MRLYIHHISVQYTHKAAAAAAGSQRVECFFYLVCHANDQSRESNPSRWLVMMVNYDRVIYIALGSLSARLIRNENK